MNCGYSSGDRGDKRGFPRISCNACYLTTIRVAISYTPEVPMCNHTWSLIPRFSVTRIRTHRHGWHVSRVIQSMQSGASLDLISPETYSFPPPFTQSRGGSPARALWASAPGWGRSTSLSPANEYGDIGLWIVIRSLSFI